MEYLTEYGPSVVCYAGRMPADDLPYDALRKQYELEDASVSPVHRILFKWLAKVPTPAPFDKLFRAIKEHHSEQSMERMMLLLETVMDELRRVTGMAEKMYAAMPPEEVETRAYAVRELLLDGARKAEETRSRDRIQRIAMILAGTVTAPGPIDADNAEEMMRVAMNLDDQDVRFLKELVRIMGGVATRGRIERQNAHTKWESGFWGTRIDPDLDSAFSKLESYGLVSRIPPPNNLNITADFQNRYALLKKGLQFTEMIKSTNERTTR
jgi:hypothetical protein